MSITDKVAAIHKIGDVLVEVFHYLALFVIGATVVWSAAHDYIGMMKEGHATLENILLLFIYLELGAMIGIYFPYIKVKTPVFRRADFISSPKSVSIIKIFGKVKKWIIDMVAIRYSKSNTILFG